MKRWLTVLLCIVLGCAACSQAAPGYPHRLQSEIGAAIDAAMQAPAGTD